MITESVIRLASINALLALSIYLTLACGQLSLASAAFMGIGAYLSASPDAQAGWPFPLVLLAGRSCRCSLPRSWGCRRCGCAASSWRSPRSGFGEVLRVVIVNRAPPAARRGSAASRSKTEGWHLALAIAGVAYLLWRLRGSRMGYAFEAIREDETVARTMGINTTFYKLIAFVLSAGIAGLAGGLKAHFIRAIKPGDFGFVLAVDILTFAVVGGSINFVGPILGAVLLTLLPEILRADFLRALNFQPGWQTLLLNGVILLLIILFLPNGLISLFTRDWRRPPPVTPQDEQGMRVVTSNE